MSSNNICQNQSNTSITGTVLVGFTTLELWIQLIVFYGFICGVVSTVCSILIWIGIGRNKKLRNRFFIIVGCLTFTRTGVGIQFLIMTIYRSLRTLELVSACQRRLVCHAIHFWLIHGWTVEMFLLFTLVIDRVIAIVKSNYYRHLTPKSAFQICIGIYLVISTLKLLPSYLSEDMMEMAPCVNLYSAPSLEFNEFSQDIDFIMVGIILIIYFSLLLYVRKTVKEKKRQSINSHVSDSANIALQRQLKLMPTLRNLVLMHCGLALSSKLLLTLGVIVPNEYKQRFTAYGGIMACIDVCANVTMLLLTNADIRDASLPCMKRFQTSKVVPAAGTSGTRMDDMNGLERRASLTPSMYGRLSLAGHK